MTAMPPLRDILNNTPADAINVDFNFNTIEGHIGSELINRDGSVAMTGPLSLSGPPTAPQHAVSKQYADTSVIPVGTIWEFAGQAAPAGWALCDGASKTITDPAYAALFAVIGYAFGGVVGTNFLLPDRRGRVGIGRNAGDALFGTLGTAGGSRDLILPAHTHPITNHYHIMPHSHDMQNHTHYAAHHHALGGHVHSSPLRRGFDINNAPAPGHTNAIYPALGNAPLDFTTRPSAATEDAPPIGVGGAAQFNTGGPSGGSDWDDLVNHVTAGPSNNTTTAPSNPNTDWGGTPNTNNAGVSPANGNIPPYVTVNYIIRIG